MPTFEAESKITNLMKLFAFICIALASLSACQSLNKKNESIDKVTTVACQDAKDMMEAYASDLLPVVGKLLLNFAAKEELKNGAVCDCLLPTIKKHLGEYTEEELEAMLIDKPKRTKAFKKAIAQNSKEILTCYESKGSKSFKFVKDFIEKALK